ncbi:MAG: dTMP kinase [Coriobacteriia bacterium]|nr:dTMP kinase [Coriobacteriia bacterium]
MPLTPERHTAEPAQPVEGCAGSDTQGAPVGGQLEGNSPRGVFVTFEGGDGVGKSTHIRYVANELRLAGREVVCLREPGGTGIGESLRAMVLDPDNGEISSEAELLIYEAARAQLVREVIRPALERGAVVLCDRFSDSTIAYQAYGRGLPLDFVRRANAFATGGIVPDRTILLVLGNTRKSLARATGAGAGDRMEQAGEVFHSRVNRAFLKLAKRDPKRIRIVRSSSSRKATAAAVAAELADILPELSARAEGATPSQPAAPHGEGAAKGKPQAKRKRGGRGKRGNRG